MRKKTFPIRSAKTMLVGSAIAAADVVGVFMIMANVPENILGGIPL